jgi:hypothetical protein
MQLLILRSFLQSPVPSSLLAQPISRHSLAYTFPSTGGTKFHTHIKQAKKYFPFCAQNSHCHEMFPAVRWMFTE